MEFQHDAAELRVVIDVLKDLVTDVNLVFKEEMVSIVAMDPEKIAAVSVSLDKMKFYQRFVKNDIFIGVNMQHLYKILRGVTSDHSIRFEIHPDTLNVLKISIFNVNLGIDTVTSLYSLDIIKEEAQVPSPSFQCRATLPTSDLLKSVKNLSHGSKKITIQATKDPPGFLTLATKGSLYVYTTSVSICPSENKLQWEFFNANLVRGTYITKFIEKFLRTQVSKIVSLELNTDGLIRLSYPDLHIGTLSMVTVPISED